MLICPLCHLLLNPGDSGLTCANRHSFDRARQGYYNLLPVQFKNSREPGDNPAMVEARRRFLDGGHYAPLAKRLAELAANYQPETWLDIGCGEGYYTQQIAEALPAAEGYALDISREAVKQACRRNKQVTWLVASMARVPLADASCDLLASVFSPLDWQEAVRLLAPGGGLLRMGPTRQHLYADSMPFGHSAHAHPDTCSTIIRTGSRSAATQGWHCYSEVPGVVNFLARLRIDSPLRLIR
jgi:23S rRNA (guanine745-N1)-methyltransferase